ncbi:MAG: 3-phosphoshikimate 1-carboxyvinyltransferase [Acidobacteria bacterium]|nr:3-phosphoshikimate 1-carboxyvinyltransferase [Acidobacteriota bacterium]
MSSTNDSGKRRAVVAGSSGLRGEFSLPGDKSISHRSALFAAIGEGRSEIRNYSTARDCQSTLDCLAGLGVGIERSPSRVWVEGVGLRGLREAAGMLDAGNSGSTIRMLAGILAGQPFTTRITGDESIQRRPMKRVIDPLTLMGARIEAREGNFAPLTIHGGGLGAIDYTPPVASAQVKSCVLLAGLFANGTTMVREKTPTRNHTEVMLRECGADFSETRSEGQTILAVRGGRSLRALGDYTVAGDLSSAAFFVGAALIVPDSEIRLRHIGINPSRLALIEVLQRMGGAVRIVDERLAHGEPVADLVARTSDLRGDHELNGAVIANLIDEIPILAVIATRLNGTLTIREAGELRVKESDRIRAIVDNLRQLGAEVEEFDDGLRLRGGQRLRGGSIDSRDDHRIAMSFAVAGLIAEGETSIEGAEAAAVSLPEFYHLLAGMGASVREEQ